MTARKTDHAVEPRGVLSVGFRDRVRALYVYALWQYLTTNMSWWGVDFPVRCFAYFFPRIIIM